MGARQSNVSTSSSNIESTAQQSRRSNNTASGSRNSSHNHNLLNTNTFHSNDNDLNSLRDRSQYIGNYGEFIINNSSLPFQFLPFSFNEVKCPFCSKTVLMEDTQFHFVMCYTKPKISYNEDILTENKGECVICLEQLDPDNIIARLPCLCIYHKSCIDSWFNINRSCPLHPFN